MKHRPNHAGKLPAWERLVFATIFALMTAFVAVVTLSAVNGGVTPASRSTSSATDRIQPVTSGGGHSATRSGGSARKGSRVSLDQRLATALLPLIRSDGGHFAVGVIDISTGARAVFDAAGSFRTAGLEKADVLAALLLQHQQAGTMVSSQQAALAARMIETSSDDAESELSQAVGDTAGMTSANRQLGLTHTIMGPPGRWDLTTTTVSDQLRLLADLTRRGSVLSPASQDYELTLMGDVQSGQRWGVSAAASQGTRFAIKDGWLEDHALWVTNSMGIVDHDGQRLLIVVLANSQATRAAGISLAAAAAADAAGVVTRS